MEKSKRIWVILASACFALGVLLMIWAVFSQRETAWILKYTKLYILVCFLMVLGLIDIKTRLIPNRLLLILIGIRMAFFAAESVWHPSLVRHYLLFMLTGSLISFVILIMCRLLAKNSIGMGDIKLFLVIGLYFGYDILYVMFFSFLWSAIYSIIMMMMKKKSRKDTIPLAPFVFFGTIVTIICV